MPRRVSNGNPRVGTCRPGAILVVVLALLALLAVVALTFVFYAADAATAARYHREAQSVANDPALPDPVPAFLGQLIYPVADTGADTTSAIRGHDLARLAYGYDPARDNTTPYTGTGLFHEPLTLPGVGVIDRAEVINFTYRPDPNNPGGGALVDPEHTNWDGTVRTGPGAPFARLPAAFVGKNAPYTYPDRNNAAVGIADPNTGQVVIPSFHRPTLFGRLDPPGTPAANPNWTAPAGRLKLLRPRPADHVLGPGDVPEFPYPPANADGGYTGDVQNLWGGVGVQRNDSVWLYANLGVVEWRGRRVTPLVAPLVLPLDGRVNVNAAGNMRNGGGHASNMGFGPHEVNLAAVFGRNAAGQPGPAAAALVTQRYGGAEPPAPRGTTTAVRSFHPDPTTPTRVGGQSLPQEYARVDWDGAGAAGPVRPPARFGSNPVWPAGQFDNSSYTAPGPARPAPTGEAVRHPGLFNPYHWDEFRADSPSPANRLFPVSDLRWFGPRYAGPADEYASQTVLGRPGTPFADQFNGSGYAHPANAIRLLVTPISNTHHRPGLAPNFPAGGGGYRFDGGPAPAPPALGPTTAGRGPDLSGVDLNRPLADYRTNRLRPLGPANVGNLAAAWRDRQALAADVHAALVVATGAALDPDARRRLAQFAANVVDFIDTDDVSTPFVWNPLDPADPLAAANFAPAELAARVVFGVEKPRLVVNEVYAEVANDPADAAGDRATRDFQVRFFVELLNAGGGESSNSPLGYDLNTPGAVPLRYRGGGPAFSAYRVAVFDDGGGVRADLDGDQPGNVAGRVGVTPKLVCDFLDVGVLDPAQPASLADRVEPNGASYAAKFPGRNGFAVIGPQLDPAAQDTDKVAFVPDPAADPRFRLTLQKPTAPPGVPDTAPTNRLSYPWPKDGVGRGDVADKVVGPLNRRDHAVVLQRLACPYAPEGPTNPYLTVDYATGVTVHDAIRLGAEPNPAANGLRDTLPKREDRWSLGRVQPYAAAGDPAQPYPQSLVLKQQNLDPTGKPVGVQASFFRHNGATDVAPPLPVVPGTDRLLAPFEWLAHLDRRLVNPTELLHVAAVRPHELTHRFAAPRADGPPLFHQHDLQHPGGPLFAAGSPLYRTFDVLAVKPWQHGTPAGGRVPGKINLNLIWDRRVFDAVLDPQPGNSFTPADGDAIWNGLTATRTPGFPESVGPTVDEVGPGGDRPFKGLGAPTFRPGGAGAAAAGIDDTVFRPRPADGLPLFRRPDAIPSVPLHPHAAWEPLRKAANHVTTVSDTYLVLMTVGWFEVRGGSPADPNAPVVLGREVFDAVPGDLRARHVAVVDRTNLVARYANPTDEAPWIGDLQAGVGPAAAGDVVAVKFFAATDAGPQLDPLAARFEVIYEGSRWALDSAAGTRFFVGVGAGRDELEVFYDPTQPATRWAFDPASGVVTVAARVRPAGLRPHAAGEVVSNAVFGNPGPQPGFDPLARRARPVVRFSGRLRW